MNAALTEWTPWVTVGEGHTLEEAAGVFMPNLQKGNRRLSG